MQCVNLGVPAIATLCGSYDICVYVSHLNYGDVSVQHGEGEGCPVATVRMHRRMFWGACWNLAAQSK